MGDPEKYRRDSNNESRSHSRKPKLMHSKPLPTPVKNNAPRQHVGDGVLENHYRHHQSGGDAGRMLGENTYGHTSDALEMLAKYRSKYPEEPVSRSHHRSGIGNKYNDVDSIGISMSSGKSRRSNKTVNINKSSRELRKLVSSSCRLHEYVEKSLHSQDNDCDEPKIKSHEYNHQLANEQPRSPLRYPEDGTIDNYCGVGGVGGSFPCTGYVVNAPAPKNYLQRTHCPCSTRKPLQKNDIDLDLSAVGSPDASQKLHDVAVSGVSVNDVVNSKVINPMIKKLQRMYLNNLKEEMSLLEDLESLPNKVNEVYKSNAYKK